MSKLLNIGARLAVHTMGKAFEVTHVALTVDDANAFMMANPDSALIDTVLSDDGRELAYLIARLEPMSN